MSDKTLLAVPKRALLRRLILYAGAALAILIGIGVLMAAPSRAAGGVLLALCVVIGINLAFKAAPTRIVKAAYDRLLYKGQVCACKAGQLRDRGRSKEAATYARKAAAYFEEVLHLNPVDAEAIAGQGRCLALLGRTRDGAAALAAAIALDPGNTNSLSHLYLGLCQLELGDLSAARELLLRDIVRPDDARATSIDVYNYGERVVRAAAQARDEGDHAAEYSRYREAAQVFDLALEIHPANKRAQQARKSLSQELNKALVHDA